jgi:hypothetical protein
MAKPHLEHPAALEPEGLWRPSGPPPDAVAVPAGGQRSATAMEAQP